MRKSARLKTVIEWTSFVIFLLVALFAVANCKGGDNDWQSAELETAQSTGGGGDIESQIEKPKKTGAVWGVAGGQGPAKTQNAAVPNAPKAQKADTNTKIEANVTVAALPEKKPVKTPAPLKSGEKTAVKTESNDSVLLSKEKYLLKSNRKKGTADVVETLLEVAGTVKQPASELNPSVKATDNKMEVIAGFRYEERISKAASAGGGQVAVRQYNLAKSKMKIGDRTKAPELDEKIQTIVCSLEQDKVSLFSPKGSLRGEQLLLIEDLPGNTLTIDRLLPEKAVAVGETWKVSDQILRSFLSVDAVIESNVTAVLSAVADDMAMVEVVGDVSGVYLGAATEMSVRAKYQFDLKAKRINWLGLLIEEDRSIGHVGPGLNLTAKVQVKISPLAEAQVLTDTVMDTIVTEPDAQMLALKYDGGKGPWRFAHDRSWYVFQDDPQAAILRRLEDGELIAQCNIADMGTVDPRTMTTIDKFQQDLVAGLGKNFGKVVSAEEHVSKAGYKVYQVLIDGMVDDLPLRWIYNLLTDKSGRQSVVVFVVEADKLDRFGDSDEVLLSTYRMGK
ncbi:MAG: hypothetical protein LBT89_09705 [Planctomycetaceae bacterium]|jgi:hypothetical protein|nr:hypothetical protein [Planctomycetaceae bacterium]